MDSKTRALLRKKASLIKADVIIGKEGINENLVKQVNMNLDANELVKISVLTEQDYKQLLHELAKHTKAEEVCSIGKKIVLYRYSSRKGVKHVLDVKEVK